MDELMIYLTEAAVAYFNFSEFINVISLLQVTSAANSLNKCFCSALHRTKNYLHTMMALNQLSYLITFCIHKDRGNYLNAENVTRKFVFLHERKDFLNIYNSRGKYKGETLLKKYKCLQTNVAAINSVKMTSFSLKYLFSSFDTNCNARNVHSNAILICY